MLSLGKMGGIQVGYLLMIGIVIQLSGAQWDLLYHVHNPFETFLTAPHALLYSGVLVFLLVSLLSRKRLPLVGAGIMILGGISDGLYHEFIIHGFDELLSPSHLTFWFGIIVASYSVVRLVGRSRIGFIAYGALASSLAGLVMILNSVLPMAPIPVWRPPLAWTFFLSIGFLVQRLLKLSDDDMRGSRCTYWLKNLTKS